jgi:hypothetical protein
MSARLAVEWARRQAQRDNRELEREIRELKQQVERLSLASLALAEILRDQLGISAEVIAGKMQEIDLRDGKLDGKFQPPAKQCGECGRVSSPMSANCLYCGASLPKESLLFS